MKWDKALVKRITIWAYHWKVRQISGITNISQALYDRTNSEDKVEINSGR